MGIILYFKFLSEFHILLSCTEEERSKIAIPDPVTTDPDKYKIIFENVKVRVFDYTDKPRDKTKMHHHRAFVLKSFLEYTSIGGKLKKGNVLYVVAQKI